MREQNSHSETAGPLTQIAAQLRRIRIRAAALLFIAGLSLLAAGAIGSILAWGLLDYLLRTPAWLRIAILAAGLYGLVFGVRRWVVPALRFRPSLTEVALRLEQSEQGRAAGLAGVLASGLELSREPQGPSATRWMSERVVADAQRRFAAVRASSLLKRDFLQRGLLAMALALSAVIGLGAMAGPRLMTIGASRVLTPWLGAQWPKRTAVADASAAQVHPLGSALALRAAVRRTDRAAGRTRVEAKYRIIDPSSDGSIRRVLLTGQGRDIAIGLDGTTEPASGELYERLIDPGALTTLAAPGGPPAELEYWFETEDDRTTPRRIKLVPPPAVLGAAVWVTPPEYAPALDAASKQAFVAGPIDAGAGNDQRAVIGPVLAGSQVKLEVTLNKPVSVEDEASGAERRAWLAAMFGGADLGDSLQTEFRGPIWTLSWTASASVHIPISPRDQYGLRPVEESAFAFDIVADRPPTATVTEPREDESVLATAIVSATGEGRDDVGLRDLSLRAQRARPIPGSIGAAPEPLTEPTVIAQLPGSSGTAEEASGNQVQATVQTTLDLSTLDLAPGDEVWLTALATDNFNLDGLRHDPVRSSPRKLRIIKEEDLIEQIRAELSAVRKIAIRLDQEQAEVQKATASGAVTPEDRRRQSGLTQRLGQQDETVRRLAQRVEKNRLSDQTLTGMLSDIGSLLKGAGRDSEQAASQLDAAARARPDQDQAELSPEQSQEARRAQESVREQLGRLAEMLDRGEDSWLVGRNLQRLIQQQRDLQAQTQRVGEQTMGKKAQDLSAQERTELQQIAEQQQRLADAARKAIDQLAQRGQQMEKVDAAQSEGMKKASQRGREQQVPEKMSRASQAAQQNQTSTAQEQQQQAMESLEQMLQDLNDAPKKRDEALRRVLADIIQSLDRLIREQDTQISALAAAVPASEFTGLDAPMIELNKNTMDVAEKTRADRQMARIAELVDKAAKNQEQAVAILRALPVEPESADKAEHESLRLLKLARAEAKKLQDDAAKRDSDRKRQELRAFYRDTLERQVALKGETDPLIGKAVDRRDRMRARGLGEQQEELRLSLENLREKTRELADAGVFDLAHTRLDAATATASKKLRAGQADHAVQRGQHSAVQVLRALVEALDDRAKQDDEFREDNSGGGGGGGGGGQKPPLIPPLAELRLLRAMQQEAADITRSLDDAREPTAADELSGVADLQRSLAEHAQDLIKKLQQPGAPPEKPGKD